MPAPTRTEIESSYIRLKYKIQVRVVSANGLVWLDVEDNAVISMSVDVSSGGTTSNGLAFGDQVRPKATIVLTNNAQTDDDGSYVVALKFVTLRETYIRLHIGYNDSDFVPIFEGVVIGKSYDDYTLTLQADGYMALIEDCKIFGTAQYKRPIATKTTIATQEDPNAGAYYAGLLNEIFWRSGGRPYEQRDINYFEESDDFRFWYSCDSSASAPTWSWFNGENLAEEAYLLARAAGGQIYQQTNILRYTTPLLLTNASSSYVFDTSRFVSTSLESSSEVWVGKITATYTPRQVQPIQEVYSDTTPRFIAPSATIAIEVQTKLPVVTYYETETTKVLPAIYLDNFEAATVGMVSSTYTAQKVSFVVSNLSSTRPLMIIGVNLKGRPIAAGQESIVTVGSLQPEKVLEQNPYIQNYYDARKLCQLTYAFYSDPLPVITLHGCTIDVDRYIGETVTLAHPDFGYWYEPMRIVGISYDYGAFSMDVKMVNIGGLPKLDDMFVLGNTYSGNDVRKMSY